MKFEIHYWISKHIIGILNTSPSGYIAKGFERRGIYHRRDLCIREEMKVSKKEKEMYQQ